MMTSRKAFLLTAFTAGAVVPISAANQNEVSGKPTNVVLIVADDHGYADFGYKKIDPAIQTPNLDKLRAQGVEFKQAYASAPICSPSRCGIITGNYQQRYGNYWFGGPGFQVGTPTLAQAFKKEGYTTAYFGKLHYGRVEDASHYTYPSEHGFDEVLTAPPGGRTHYLYHSKEAVEKYGSAAKDIMNVRPLKRNGVDEDYDGFLTEKLSQETTNFILKNKNKPFFVQLAFNAVHNFTWQLPEQYLKDWNLPPFPDLFDASAYNSWYPNVITPHLPNGRKYYIAQLYYMDREIGRILDVLEKNGLDSNTLIIYTSDNGGSSCNFGNNLPLKGQKYSMYEGGIRVPLLMKWNGKLQAGSSYSKPVSLLDLFPTALTCTSNQEANSQYKTDGKNLFPFLGKSEADVHSTLFWDGGFQYAVLKDGWKLKVITQKPMAQYVARLENAVMGEGTELYHLDEDMSESNNLVKQYPQKVRELKKEFKLWKKSLQNGEYLY